MTLSQSPGARRMRLLRDRKKLGVRVSSPLEISNYLLCELVNQGQLDEYEIDTPDGLAAAMNPLLDDCLQSLVLEGVTASRKGKTAW